MFMHASAYEYTTYGGATSVMVIVVENAIKDMTLNPERASFRLLMVVKLLHSLYNLTSYITESRTQ